MVQTAPYGTWVSPVTVEMVSGQMVGLSSLRGDGDIVYWLEQRPTEGGRVTLMRCNENLTVDEVTPAPLHVGSRVHEYGGGAYTVRDGLVVFSNRTDGAVWICAPGEIPQLITQVPGCRYTDFCLPIKQAPEGPPLVYCVREDHRNRPANDPKATIVALDISTQTPPEKNEGTVMVQGADFLSSPRPSPDGRHMAWISWNHPDMPWDASKLYVAPIDGARIGPPRQLAGMMREAVVQPDWSPAGVLHFCTDRNGWWNIYRALDESARVCPMTAEIGGPHWVFGQRYYDFMPDGAIVAARNKDGVIEAVLLRNAQADLLPLGQVQEAPVPISGGLAYISAPPSAPPKVVVMRHGMRQTVRVSGETDLTEDDVSVGLSLLFPIAGSLTGHAFWYPPRNAHYRGPENEKPPLIVISHGGPTGMSTNAFSARIQWWTSRGFGVVDVNYGGSTGFGRAYRERLEGQWGVVDVADCIAAVNYLIELEEVDRNRVAIRGSSAGGFTTLSALASSSLFKAGASHYGVADLRLLAADTHKFEARYLDRLVGKLPDAAAIYDQRSPLKNVERMKCPVIFFQGLEDKVVPPNQARAMSSAMSARGLVAPLHEFESEGHGFRRAETIRAVLELETMFYGHVFGFEPVIES